MKKLLLAILITVFLTSCPFLGICICRPGSIQEQNRGQVIREYPDWCCGHNKLWDLTFRKLNAFGYSEWIDWQSEQGKSLHNLIRDDVISDDYKGKFRIDFRGQLITIHFNDAKSGGETFFGYIGDYKNYYKDRLIDIDINSDKVEFDCWLRRVSNSKFEFSDGCSDDNKSTFSLVKIDDKTFYFSLTVGGDKIIDNMILKNDSNTHKTAFIEKKYSWLPYEFNEVVGTDYWKNGYYGWRLYFDYENGNLDLGTLCFEGISLRSVDEENKKISFWLEDREKSDFADYLEIHITKEDWTDEPKRGADKDNKSLMKGTLGFYKEGNSTPIIFYDEEHSEFSRLVD